MSLTQHHNDKRVAKYGESKSYGHHVSINWNGKRQGPAPFCRIYEVTSLLTVALSQGIHLEMIKSRLKLF